MRRKLILLALLAALAPTVGFADTGPTVALTSEAFLGVFSQETPGGKKETGVPAYEYLGVDVGVNQNLSAHLYGWGRYDFGGFYEPTATGDLAYAYVRYTNSGIINLDARLGRIHLLNTPTGLSIDGFSGSVEPLPWLGLTVWGGLPVDMNDLEGMTGDSAYGASATGRLPGWGGLTASYMKVENDSTAAQELMSIDAFAAPLDFLTLTARGVYNVDSGQWQSRNASLPVTFGGFTFTPNYSFVLYEAFFDTGARTGTPFSNPFGSQVSLAQSGEELTTVGVDLSYETGAATSFGAKYKSYSYEIRPDDATYYALLASTALYGAFGGIEVGRMDGGTDRDTYDLLRLWTSFDHKPLFYGVDASYAKYGENIYGPSGDDSSLALSLCGGVNLRGEGEKVKLTLTYARDPNFKQDLRALFTYEFTFTL